MSEEEREVFEAFIVKTAQASNYRYMSSLLNRIRSGGYLVTWVDSMFEGWKAGRNYASNEPIQAACFKMETTTKSALSKMETTDK